MDEQRGSKTADIALLFAAISAGAALLYLLYGAKDQTYWPDLGDVPLVLRHVDANFLPRDFYSNQSTGAGKAPFVWLYGALMQLTGGSWQSIFVAGRVASQILVPALFVAAIANIGEVWRSFTSGVERRLYFFLLVPAAWLGTTPLAKLFRISHRIELGGFWYSSAVALFLGSAAILALEAEGIVLPLLGAGLFLAAGLFHPVLGTLVAAVYLLFKLGGGERWRIGLAVVFGIVLPLILGSALFSDPQAPSAQQFADVYAWLRHPHHYIPSHYGETDKRWPFDFIGLCLVLGLNVLWAQRRADRFHLRVSLLALAFCFGAIALQYGFVERFPVFAVVAYGPSRGTLFGYWLVVLLSGRIVALLAAPRLFPRLQAWALGFSRWRLVTTVALLAIAALAAVPAYWQASASEVRFEAQYRRAWSWFAAPQGSILVGPLELVQPGVREVLGYGLYVDSYFPFRASAAPEYGRRLQSVWGARPFAGERPTAEAAYSAVTRQQALAILQRGDADYWIARRRDMKKFAPAVPQFQGPGFVAFARKDLAAAAAVPQ